MISLLEATLLAMLMLQCSIEASELNYVVTGGNCLTLSHDQRTLFLSPCGTNTNQLFDLDNSKIQVNSLCLDSRLEMNSCYAPATTWWFYGDGRIVNQEKGPAGCLGTALGGTKLIIGDCNQQVALFATTTAPPALPTTSRLPTLPSLDQALPLPPQPVVAAATTPQIVTQPPVDLTLCTCIVDAKDEACDQAVRSACMMGRLNSEWCRESFTKGQHDNISDQILQLLSNGEDCTDLVQVRAAQQDEAQRRGQLSLQGTPSKADHYLCVCLDQNEPVKCKFAIQAACLVGHIPAGDCAASLERNDHEGASNHVLKLIDSGATCSQKLVLAATQQKKSVIGRVKSMFSLKRKREITKDDKDLCYCLDSFNGEECIRAVKRACKAGKIPQQDCEVASKDYSGGTTRHVLRLIDHGADCPAHRSMTFTNHGCHCLQSWTHGKEIFTFPNNCADPKGERGYAWCKTYASEQCTGVQGSTEWDRCDAPKYPTFHQQDDVETSEHYLCVCLSDSSTDEVCIAAVKSACQVGHLPSEQCKESFDSGEHGKVSDSILQLLDNGKKCNAKTMQRLMTNVDRTATVAGGNQCAEGYFGFPNCRRIVPCEKKCKGRGSTCDFDLGVCTCLPNFVGSDCSRCAPGTSGRHCLFDSELIAGEYSFWSFLQLILFVGIAYYIVSSCLKFSLVQHIRARKWSFQSVKDSLFAALYRRRQPAAPSVAQYGVIPPEEEEEEEQADLGSDDVEMHSKAAAAAPTVSADAKKFTGLAV